MSSLKREIRTGFIFILSVFLYLSCATIVDLEDDSAILISEQEQVEPDYSHTLSIPESDESDSVKDPVSMPPGVIEVPDFIIISENPGLKSDLSGNLKKESDLSVHIPEFPVEEVDESTAGDDSGSSETTAVPEAVFESVTPDEDEGDDEDESQNPEVYEAEKDSGNSYIESTDPVIVEIPSIHRELSVAADPGIPHGIALDGPGWVYLEGEEEPCSMRTRTLSGEQTLFSFLFPEEGEFSLSFLNQNLDSGSFQRLELAVHVLSASTRADEEDEGGVDPVAGEAATEEEPVPGSAEGFLRAMEQEDYTSFSRGWNDFLDTGPVLDFDFMKQVSDFLGIHGIEQDLKTTLHYWVQADSSPGSRDEIYIRLGRFYETNNDFRDERLAMEYYQKLINQFPASYYWEEADRRIKYLKRHFFQIR